MITFKKDQLVTIIGISDFMASTTKSILKATGEITSSGSPIFKDNKKGARKQFTIRGLDAKDRMVFAGEIPFGTDSDVSSSDGTFTTRTIRGNACFNLVGEQEVIKDWIINKNLNPNFSSFDAVMVIMDGKEIPLFPSAPTSHAVVSRIRSELSPTCDMHGEIKPCTKCKAAADARAKEYAIKAAQPKHYKLIVGHDFSISNETDSDPQSDYSPGIWAISSQKNAIKYAKEYLDKGAIVTVTDYNEPRYHALANKMIKELGLKQPLFQEPEAIPASTPTNGNPSTLSALKKHLQQNTRIVITNFHGNGQAPESRETFVRSLVCSANSSNVILDKNGGRSWLEFGKASEWSFDDKGATRYDITREGTVEKSTRIEYVK